MRLQAKANQLNIDGLIYDNAYLESTMVTIDKTKDFLNIRLTVTYGVGNTSDVTLFLTFVTNGSNSQIDDGGTLVDLIPFLEGGGIYDKTKIIWGQPTTTEAKRYLDLDSVWGELEFTTDQPERQIAIDYVGSREIFPGIKIEDVFEMPI